jgi:L-lactate dehydrogenase complex protein LldF
MKSQKFSFSERVQQAQHDARLQGALQYATTRFVTNRLNAYAALSDGEALRDQARAIRAKSLARLDELLEQLTECVEARGGHVCWAADGAAACRYILGLAQARGVSLVAKSKSMASEEIHLNEALEQAGIEIAETDLGEYIIQLAGETPSHIIAPAIHKTREQVSALFEQHLHTPPTDDIPTLTRIARQTLRQRFLRADMGISGVNFGVAEQGAIAMVTNEGNARLTTTAPRIHVAIMGIERVVETLDDLGVVLQVLGRSATGQKLSVYTTIISGPARADEPDGADEFHLVLLDNGRSEILGSPYAEVLMCIRCGACLNVCPVYQSIGGHAYGGVYSGPIGAVLTPLLQPDLPDVHLLPHASSLCGACQEACPVRIALPDMFLRLRADAVQAGKAAPAERMAMHGWRELMNHPPLYRGSGWLAALATHLMGGGGALRTLPPPLDAWTRSRDFPSFARQSFTAWWQQQQHNDERNGGEA